ncbi:FAD-dependent oxidoreductase [Sutterella sp.]|uniref:FAD-dependent oxidoreductase n=1 Tax=Sutterella sp. TaxID=1981025 RepID=UPI0026E00B71|nr:FAD-dependent oxidoreductase [Sutterella sp.]MDO5532171.1 FAD-dependent oxidoreductase [Sutterella sp.]
MSGKPTDRIRRRLLGAGAAGAALSWLPGAALADEDFFAAVREAFTSKPAWATELPLIEERCDVVIAGSGGAGLSAALAAAQDLARGISGRPPRVVVLEKARIAGGHTLLASGSFAAEESPAGILGMRAEMMAAGAGRNDVELADVVCRGSWAAKERLAALGVTWCDVPFRAVGAPSARCWNSGASQSGYDYVQALMRGVRAAGVEVRFSTRAESLLLADTGEAMGVFAHDGDGRRILFRAPSIVLATGGFTANRAMIARYRPDIPATMGTTAGARGEAFDGSTGDGILMAAEIGARLRDMDALEIIPFAGGRLIDYVGAEIWLNARGERFVSEGADFLTVRNAMSIQPDGVMWAVTDVKSAKGATFGLKLLDGTVMRAESLAELARGIGCNAAALEETIVRYNRSVAKHWDDDFGIPMTGGTIDTPPFFYGREVFSLHYSSGGVAITPRAEVLTESGKIIPGLFAAGETTGGVHGATKLGGCGLADAFVFGDLAGHAAAQVALARNGFRPFSEG